MGRSTLHLETIWEIEARRNEIAEVLSHAETFADWWGGVYLASELVDPGNADGTGRIVNIRSKGLLPYDLTWSCCVIKSDLPDCWEAETLGDLCGKSTWKLIPGPSSITVYFDWMVSVGDTPLAAMITFARPLMAFNHRWAMSRGLDGLVCELQRRRNVLPLRSASGVVRGRCLGTALA